LTTMQFTGHVEYRNSGDRWSNYSFCS